MNAASTPNKHKEIDTCAVRGYSRRSWCAILHIGENERHLAATLEQGTVDRQPAPTYVEPWVMQRGHAGIRGKL